MSQPQNTSRPLDEALDRVPKGGGIVRVECDDGEAEVDVVDADRLGVKVRSVSIHRNHPVDIAQEAASLPDRMRSLPDRIEPVEVDPELGGARLRTRPDELRRNEYFEVEVERERTSIHKTRTSEDGTRSPADFTLSREQLDRLIDEASG